LVQSGYIGLIEASKNFKENQGASFETFASIRIKGAIIDELRKNSWSSREASKSMKDIEKAIHAIEQRKQARATAEEIVAELKISFEDYDKMCQKINVCNVLNMDHLETYNLLPGDEQDPGEMVLQDDIKNKIKELLLTLPERERILLSLYYIDELTFKDIGEILDLTEARVCQLHAAAIAKIKTRI